MGNVDLKGFKHLMTLNVDGPLHNAHYFLIISKLMEKIHSRIPRENYNLSKIATPVEYREEFFKGENHKRAVLFLLTNGCEWAIKGAHGCTICGHLAKQTRSLEPITAEDLISQFIGEFEKINFKEAPIFNLYNNGSFFNEHEIPEKARIKMFKKINNNKDIKMIVLETRPEFITDKLMEQTKALMPDIHVEVAMGLETIDDFKRMISVNKGFTLKQYDEAIQIILKYHLYPRSYVLLKPPFFSEKEGVDEAINTIKHAFNAGSFTVSLEACTYQKYTLTEYLFDNGLYQLPKLWSILDVVKKTHHLGKLIVGLFQFYPSPEHVPYNCNKCSNRVLDAIKDYNRTLQIKALEDIDCNCRKNWEYELHYNPETFQNKLEAFRKKVIEDDLLDS
jgi:radical SAM enzyme (TIGR01210 family)